MDVVVAGGHGKVGLRLLKLLAARGDRARGLIRNPDHAADLEAVGAEAVVADLEQLDDVTSYISGADAVVFAAGAGPGSGAARKWSVDRDGAIKLLDAARAAGARRYVIVSSVGAEDPPPGDDVFNVYLRAKAEADAAVTASDRDWTVVRPGRLTDDPATGTVSLTTTPARGEVTRDDVAAVLAAVLPAAHTHGLTLYLNGGETPIDAAVNALGS
jgi:uncharacterized protein YbjT (DUF2867 family)